MIDYWQPLLALFGIVVTAILAPRLADRRKDRAETSKAEIDAQAADVAAMRSELAEARAGYRADIAELKAEIREKDAKVMVLQAQVGELRVTVEMFQRGLQNPHGYVLIPGELWSAVRERLGDDLPPGPFVGEGVSPVSAPAPAPKFGHIGLRGRGDLDPSGP